MREKYLAWPSTTKLPLWVNRNFERMLIITKYDDGIDVRELDPQGDIHLGRYGILNLEKFDRIRKCALDILVGDLK
jgi:hypothetical protein